MYGVYLKKSKKEFRNSSWYQSQFSETLIPSGHLLFRPSFIPAKSLWPYLNPIISLSLSLSLIPVISPCSQSQGRKRFLIGRIVVRKHSPPTTFPVNFSGELSGKLFQRWFFLHRKDRLEEISSFSQSTGARKPSTRRPRAFFQPAREPLSGDALPPPGSPDADQPPFLPVCAIQALHVPLLGFFCLRGPSDQFFRRPPAIFSQLQSLHVPWEVFFYLSGP